MNKDDMYRHSFNSLKEVLIDHDTISQSCENKDDCENILKVINVIVTRMKDLTELMED